MLKLYISNIVQAQTAASLQGLACPEPVQLCLYLSVSTLVIDALSVAAAEVSAYPLASTSESFLLHLLAGLGWGVK